MCLFCSSSNFANVHNHFPALVLSCAKCQIQTSTTSHLSPAGRADILELVLWLEGNSVDARSGFAHALDDSNFEHLTQASSGATTGDWFVLL